ncbi:MAG: type IV pilus modification PilV family protein [Opitutaceae bacterium]
MNHQAKCRKGFTLTEVVVALGIFSMVIAGGLIGLRRGYELIGNSRDYTRISQILQSEVEALRTLAWDDLIEFSDNTLIKVETQFDLSAYDAYTVRRRIYTESATLRRVEVTVSFKNDQGRLVTLKYLTFFTKGGVNDYFYRTI